MRGEHLDQVGEQTGRAGDVHGEAVPVAAGDVAQFARRRGRSRSPSASSTGTTTCSAWPSSLGIGGGSGVTTPGIWANRAASALGPLPVRVGDPGGAARRRPGPGWSARSTKSRGEVLGPGRLGVGGQEGGVVVGGDLAEPPRVRAGDAADHQPGQTTATAISVALPPRPDIRTHPGSTHQSTLRGRRHPRRSTILPRPSSGGPGWRRTHAGHTDTDMRRPPAGAGGRTWESSPDWTRTNNLPVNSRLLCQLSYRGSCSARLRISPTPCDGTRVQDIPRWWSSGLPPRRRIDNRDKSPSRHKHA